MEHEIGKGRGREYFAKESHFPILGGFLWNRLFGFPVNHSLRMIDEVFSHPC